MKKKNQVIKVTTFYLFKRNLDLKKMDNFNELVDALKTIVNDCNWQNIGLESLFQPMKCYKYSFSFI